MYNSKNQIYVAIRFEISIISFRKIKKGPKIMENSMVISNKGTDLLEAPRVGFVPSISRIINCKPLLGSWNTESADRRRSECRRLGFNLPQHAPSPQQWSTLASLSAVPTKIAPFSDDLETLPLWPCPPILLKSALKLLSPLPTRSATVSISFFNFLDNNR